MDTKAELFFQVGQVRTFTYNFLFEDKKVTEYIHCLVIEQLEVDRAGIPEQIKVNQIHNLYEYFHVGKTTMTERLLTTRFLTPIINIK